MFDIKVVQLTEASGRECKYKIGPVGRYGAMGVKLVHITPIGESKGWDREKEGFRCTKVAR